MDKSDKREKKGLDTLPATMVMILIALLLVFAGYTYLAIKQGFTIDDLIDNIVGNLLGVLAAFLLFDILYNKLTQDAYAKETSQEITKTLMGDPTTLDAFSDEDKQVFLESTIKSIVKDQDAVDMLVGNTRKYVQQAQFARIRKSFDYTISLSTELPARYDEFPGAKGDEYFYVQENLNYEAKYLSGRDANLTSKEVKIGFCFDKRSLDAGLLESDDDPEFSKCVFNENLDVTKEAIEYLRNLPKNRLKDVFEELFTAVLKVDGKQGILAGVDVRDGGIVATYLVDYDTTANGHTIRVIFHMPKLWNSVFEVTLVDPTKAPKITFDYIPDRMEVTMYSYLNKETEANDGAYEQKNGIYDIAIKDEWIYPKSGIVFSVKRKK